MQLLLKRNYLIFTVEQNSNEWVQVSVRKGSVDHQPWRGFVDKLAYIEGKTAYIPCNGWRGSDKDRWRYLSEGEYVAGVLTNDGVFAFHDNATPVLVNR